jgi:hypothetical protein
METSKRDAGHASSALSGSHQRDFLKRSREFGDERPTDSMIAAKHTSRTPAIIYTSRFATFSALS